MAVGSQLAPASCGDSAAKHLERRDENGRSIPFQTPSASRTSAALLLLSAVILSGVIAAACGPTAGPGSTPQPASTSPPTSSRGTEGSGLVADALSPCAGVSLDARLEYRPNSWTDGNVSFVGGSLTFPIPSEIPVTAGASAKGQAKLSFSSGGGASTTCVYRGNGDFASDGTRYLFKKCRLGADRENDESDIESDGPADPLRIAGSIVTADTFRLHVQKGDKHFPATEIHLALPGPVVSDDTPARRIGAIWSPAPSVTRPSRSTTATNARPIRATWLRVPPTHQSTACSAEAKRTSMTAHSSA